MLIPKLFPGTTEIKGATERNKHHYTAEISRNQIASLLSTLLYIVISTFYIGYRLVVVLRK